MNPLDYGHMLLFWVWGFYLIWILLSDLHSPCLQFET